MKLKVYEEKKKNQEVFIKLEQDNDEIDIIASDDKGNRSIIAYLTADGTLKLCNCICRDFGFNLNSDGSILVKSSD
jgi:hypothetical protein